MNLLVKVGPALRAGLSSSAEITLRLRAWIKPRPARRAGPTFILLLACAAVARAGYKIENVAYPAEIRGGISAVTFTPAGTLVISTRYGEVWMRDAPDRWRRFARGLDEPMGLVADSERVVYIAHRPELLRATDRDGDGAADTFETIGGKWGLSINYHEFFFGLKRDRAGNFYGAASLDSSMAATPAAKAEVEARPVRGQRDYSDVIEPSFHRSETSWRGWAVRITADGKFEPWASGFRQPNGIGLSPEGELFFTDNQGDYKPSTGLLHVERGDFHGHAQSLKWEPGYDSAKVTVEALWRRHKSPAVVFPHGPMGLSPGEPVWDVSGGRFGPFAGQVFTGDYSKLVIRASLERVAGTWQGACYPFLGRNENAPFVTGEKLKAGVTRGAFAPDGSLYLAASAGWGAGEDGLQRIAWDGNAIAELREVKLTERGFAVAFTRPMDATIANADHFAITRFRYYYHVKYGSPWIDEARVPVKEVKVSADGLGAELVLSELTPGFVYELSVPKLRTRDQQPLVNPLAYYTVKTLRNGEAAIGGTTRLPQPNEASLAAKDAATAEAASRQALLAAGERTYRTLCVGCHQPDGRGIPGGAANFLEDKTRLAKPDAQLLDLIAKGNEPKGMPAYGSILNAAQRRAVLAYIREAFGR